jgi:Na+/H+ antiporter NhaB
MFIGSNILVYNVAFVLMLLLSFMLFGIIDTPFFNNWLAITSSFFTLLIMFKCVKSVANHYKLTRLK